MVEHKKDQDRPLNQQEVRQFWKSSAKSSPKTVKPQCLAYRKRKMTESSLRSEDSKQEYFSQGGQEAAVLRFLLWDPGYLPEKLEVEKTINGKCPEVTNTRIAITFANFQGQQLTVMEPSNRSLLDETLEGQRRMKIGGLTDGVLGRRKADLAYWLHEEAVWMVWTLT